MLLDGSADFLLVLRDKGEVKKPSLARIDAVMNLAYWLHQDFMVDRTEIILAASGLDSVAKNIAANYDSLYSLECEIRCFEDRFLEYRLDDVRKKIVKNVENSGKDTSKEKKLLVTFEITAGRKDFLLRFFNEEVSGLSNLTSKKCWHFDGFRDGLKELLKVDGGFAYIDRIEVNVNRKPPELADELKEKINSNP